MKLNTAEDWWEAVTEAWKGGEIGESRLERLLFGDVGIPMDASTNQIVEREKLYGRGSTMAALAFTGLEGLTVHEAVSQMVKEKDRNLWYFFQSVWQDAPNHPKIHSWTMWGGFCDLLSEGPNCLWTEEEQKAQNDKP